MRRCVARRGVVLALTLIIGVSFAAVGTPKLSRSVAEVITAPWAGFSTAFTNGSVGSR